MLTALYELPLQRRVVYRGVKLDLHKIYAEEGAELIWWAFSSTTDNKKVLESEMFLGKKGKRSLFTVDALGVDIAAFSAHKEESEFLILPGTCVRVHEEGQKIGRQLWEFTLRVPDDLAQMLDLKHPQWVSHADTEKIAGVKVVPLSRDVERSCTDQHNDQSSEVQVKVVPHSRDVERSRTDQHVAQYSEIQIKVVPRSRDVERSRMDQHAAQFRPNNTANSAPSLSPKRSQEHNSEAPASRKPVLQHADASTRDVSTEAPALSRTRKPGLKHAGASACYNSGAPALPRSRKPVLQHANAEAPVLSRSRKPVLQHFDKTH